MKLKRWQKIGLSLMTIGVTGTLICLGIDKYRKYAADNMNKKNAGENKIDEEQLKVDTSEEVK